MPAEPANPTNNRLVLLYQLTTAFNSSLDLDEVLNRVMDEVIAAMRAERGFVMLYENEAELVFKVARGLDQKTIEDPQFHVSRSVVRQVASSGQAVLTSDAQSDARFNIRESIVFMGLRSILCVPLLQKGRTIGVLYVDNRLQAGIFTHEDLDLLNAIASSAATAIENARLYQLAVEKGRLEQELQMARRVQLSLLPRSTPQIDGWRFSARWKPKREVSGDYYDFIPLANGRWGVVIADVTDKSMGAALFMAFTRSIVRASIDVASTAASGIQRVNELICNESEEGLYVTLFYTLLDPHTGSITYVNAGHNPGLLLHQGINALQIRRLVGTGIPLGVDDNSAYAQGSAQLSPGDMLLLYTDGVIEAEDGNGRQFGLEGLEKICLDNAHLSTDQIADVILAAIGRYTPTGQPDDDLTLVVIRRE
jgi:serine phosphatase RsbU (regulator of sigma subunit)